jgi:hypothetical protein
MWTDTSPISGWIARAILSTSVELQSPLPPAQCLDRLKQDTDSYWKLFGDKPVIGRVHGSKFSGYKRINYRNSFRTQVRAVIEANGNGCHIILRFGVHPFVLVFMAFWLTCVLGIGAPLGWNAYIHGVASKENLMSAAIPLFMGVFGVCLYVFGRWLARNEQAFLLEFMMTSLAAKMAR